MKRLLAVGCSFTDKDFESLFYPEYDCSFPKWPEIVGNKLGMEVLNLGKCGYGNDQISNIVITELLKNHDNIDVVMIGWSELWRYSPYDFYRINPMHASKNNETKYHDSMWSDVLKVYPGSRYPNALKSMVTNFYKQILRVQRLCKLLNVKLIHHSLVSGLEMHRFSHAAKMYETTWNFNKAQWAQLITEPKDFYDIDKNSLIGYPFIKDLGGYSYVDSDKFTSDTRIGKLDGHPNAQGHEDIAEMYYEHYKKIYL